MSRGGPDRLRRVATPWTEVVLVCSKCSKKLKGGFGESQDDSLARGLKQVLRKDARRGAVRVVETKCLGLCPRGAVAMLRGNDPGGLLAVPPGTDLHALLAGAVARRSE